MPILRKALGITAGAGTAIFLWDQYFNSQALSRTGRTIFVASLVGLDYKINWGPDKDIEALHDRSARRVYDLIIKNRGLYVKMGQMVAMQSHMLPNGFRERLPLLFDRAPADEWPECEALFRQETGKEVSDVFEYVDPVACASASMAQVHEGRLPNGDRVAIKIQHPDIEKLTWWDLNSLKAMIWIYDKILFDMPMFTIAKYFADAIETETDFNIERSNAKLMKKLVEGDAKLKHKVYVPGVYDELSTKRVMVMEWADGTALSKIDKIKREFDAKAALSTVFELTCKQVYEWGVVHCDPHPGNWFVTRENGRQMLIMLDHGLYVHMSQKLTQQYAALWNGFFQGDIKKISEIVQDWGFGSPEQFTSATMLTQEYEDIPTFENEQHAKEQMRNFLKDTSRIPLQLLFVARTHRILQGLNRLYDSPVNRIKTLLDGASEVMLRNHSGTRLNYYLALLWRRLVLLVNDIVFIGIRIQQVFTHRGLEDFFDSTIEETAKELVKDA
ncbi:ABC1 family protein C10F6.14c [Wickerhamiella sorbophila]|uniref:ABC1 family protein C10F6.14c n=1 Tax=Wickerhamiella sorbophila TaxID=45607 RepID=A0A2T0FPF8_9ASCO|nr:ABC1 family protein C10F6.14c [Wickerhamiella sorbophila]PRT56849.1 ABC1 family protein C10F6.14c [Wickerhamiella sorbophila]